MAWNPEIFSISKGLKKIFSFLASSADSSLEAANSAKNARLARLMAEKREAAATLVTAENIRPHTAGLSRTAQASRVELEELKELEGPATRLEHLDPKRFRRVLPRSRGGRAELLEPGIFESGANGEARESVPVVVGRPAPQDSLVGKHSKQVEARRDINNDGNLWFRE